MCAVDSLVRHCRRQFQRISSAATVRKAPDRKQLSDYGDCHVQPLSKTYRWVYAVLDQRSYSTLRPVSAWMGDRLRADKLSRYITSHPGQLSLAIPQWVSAMSTSLGWEGNRVWCHTGHAWQTIVVYPPGAQATWEPRLHVHSIWSMGLLYLLWSSDIFTSCNFLRWLTRHCWCWSNSQLFFGLLPGLELNFHLNLSYVSLVLLCCCAEKTLKRYEDARRKRPKVGYVFDAVGQV